MTDATAMLTEPRDDGGNRHAERRSRAVTDATAMPIDGAAR